MGNINNSCKFAGRLAAPAELTYTPSGQALCKFRIAVDNYGKQPNGQPKPPSFFSCSIWREKAELFHKWYGSEKSKGRPVLVEGKMSQRTVVNNESGTKRDYYELEVHDFSPPDVDYPRIIENINTKAGVQLTSYDHLLQTLTAARDAGLIPAGETSDFQGSFSDEQPQNTDALAGDTSGGAKQSAGQQARAQAQQKPAPQQTVQQKPAAAPPTQPDQDEYDPFADH